MKFLETTENLLQSAFPEKTKKATKYGVKLFKGKCRKIYTIYSLTVIGRQSEPTKGKKTIAHQTLFSGRIFTENQ